MNTPEFLIWAIEYTCPIRGFQNGSNPERTERQLRAGRAVSDARRDGRAFEGLCIQTPDGFRINDALAVYGGFGPVEQACGNCLANAIQRVFPQSLAGCYGVVPLPADESQMHDAVERAIVRLGVPEEVERLFPTTQPRWYGLWISSPLEIEQAELLDRLLADTDIVEIGGTPIAEFRLGLQAARGTGLRLHVSLLPRGVVANSQWQVVRHCLRCHAPWVTEQESRGRPEARPMCGACGYTGHPAPEKKRMARGKRPYYPLDRLLGAEQAKAFLARYAAHRGQQASPHWEQSPPPPAPPDNPPAD